MIKKSLLWKIMPVFATGVTLIFFYLCFFDDSSSRLSWRGLTDQYIDLGILAAAAHATNILSLIKNGPKFRILIAVLLMITGFVTVGVIVLLISQSYAPVYHG